MVVQGSWGEIGFTRWEESVESCLSPALKQKNWKSLSHAWLFVIPWTVAHEVPLSMGILQARILEWVAMPSSRGSSQPRGWTHISYDSSIGRQVLHHWCTLGSPWDVETMQASASTWDPLDLPCYHRKASQSFSLVWGKPCLYLLQSCLCFPLESSITRMTDLLKSSWYVYIAPSISSSEPNTAGSPSPYFRVTTNV